MAKKKKNKLTDKAKSYKKKPSLQYGTDLEDFSGESQITVPPVPNPGLSAAKGALSGATAGATFGPIGAGVGAVVGGISSLIMGNKAKKEQRELEKKLAIRKERVMNRKFVQNDVADLGTYEFNKGGNLPGVYKADGGSLEPVSDDAVQVQADNPQEVDSVDIGPAFVDHNEIIDNKNRVFSDTHKLPSGMSIAKKAKKLEKMKSDNPRFSQSNQRVEQKLNDLYDYQSILNARSERKASLISGGTINIKPENKGKFTAYAKSHGKGVQEMARQIMANKEDYSSTIVKRANFARNAAKFKHQYGGDLVPRDATTMVKPIAKTMFGAKPNVDPFVGEMTVRKLAENNPKLLPSWADPKRSWLGDESKFIDDAGNLAAKPLYKNKSKKPSFQWGTEDEQALLDSFNPGATRVDLVGDPSTSASILGTFLPDIMNLQDLKRMPIPEEPATESRVTLDRLTPDAQFNRITRATREAGRNIRSNTAQSATANASMSNLLSRRLEAENQARTSTNAQNMQIAAQEAALNTGVKARNAATTNQYLQNITQRKLAQMQGRSQSRSNIAEKVLMLGRERNQKKLDQKRLDLLSKKYEDSGVFNRQLLDILLKR